MSIANAIRRIHKQHRKYVNPDLVDGTDLLSYGTLRRRLYHEESDLEDAFDDVDFPSLDLDEERNNPGQLYYSQSQITGNIRVTGDIGNSETFSLEDEDVTMGMTNARRYSGELNISFGRTGSVLLSYSNFVTQSLNVSRRFSDVIEDLFREPGDDWKKSYHIVTSRVVAANCSLIYSTSRNVSATLQVDVTADRSANISVDDEINLSQAQDMGIQISGAINSSRVDLGIVTGDEGCVPVLGFHKLKGVRRRLNLEAVR